MWMTPDDYPLSSLRANEQGVSALSLGIDTRGRIAQCQVVGTSGHPALDTAACAALQARGQFRPAQDARGCPVPFRIGQRVRWQIPIR
jgi:protein TonB